MCDRSSLVMSARRVPQDNCIRRISGGRGSCRAAILATNAARQEPRAGTQGQMRLPWCVPLFAIWLCMAAISQADATPSSNHSSTLAEPFMVTIPAGTFTALTGKWCGCRRSVCRRRKCHRRYGMPWRAVKRTVTNCVRDRVRQCCPWGTSRGSMRSNGATLCRRWLAVCRVLHRRRASARVPRAKKR